MKFLAHRIEDKKIQRMVKRFLRAGGAEDGSVSISDEGTPQKGVFSPLLANIYLHYTLDLWFDNVYRKNFIAKLKIFKKWLKKARIMKSKELWETAKAKLRGHYNYYGVTDNQRGIARFEWEVKKLLFKWLNHRGKRNRLKWERFNEMLKRFPLPKPRIKVSMFGFSVN